jgi:hypothetical protein
MVHAGRMEVRSERGRQHQDGVRASSHSASTVGIAADCGRGLRARGALLTFELMFRLYAPTKALFDKAWALPDVEEVK